MAGRHPRPERRARPPQLLRRLSLRPWEQPRVATVRLGTARPLRRGLPQRGRRHRVRAARLARRRGRPVRAGSRRPLPVPPTTPGAVAAGPYLRREPPARPAPAQGARRTGPERRGRLALVALAGTSPSGAGLPGGKGCLGVGRREPCGALAGFTAPPLPTGLTGRQPAPST